MIEKHRNYSANELRELLGDDWRKQLGLVGVPLIKNKPIITNFNEFDNETKQIYISIYNIIKEFNPRTNFNVWATGSRIKGYWRTPEEAESLAKEYNVTKVKYSDYDCITDAPVRPSLEYFYEKIGVKVDFAGGEDNRVLINI